MYSYSRASPMHLKTDITFDEVDCIGEPTDPSFATTWPSFAFKVPLGSPLKTRGSISPKIGELLMFPCVWTWAKSCCCGNSWNWFALCKNGFWTCAPKPGRICSIPWKEILARQDFKTTQHKCMNFHQISNVLNSPSKAILSAVNHQLQGSILNKSIRIFYWNNNRTHKANGNWLLLKS